MKTTDFISLLIDQIFQTFDLKQIKYAFDAESNQHTFLINDRILGTDRFMDFNKEMTLKAWELNIEGTLCFSSSSVLEKLFKFQTEINPYRNDALLGNIQWVLESINYSNSVITSEPKQLESKAYGNIEESDYSIAA
uniref:hypothetical protein n=1 Tax=Fulvivirga sp. TaxID=1931237 RepID=UPI00404AA455